MFEGRDVACSSASHFLAALTSLSVACKLEVQCKRRSTHELLGMAGKDARLVRKSRCMVRWADIETCVGLQRKVV